MSRWKKHVWATGSAGDRGCARTWISKPGADGRPGEPVAKTRKRRSESLSKARTLRLSASGTTERLGQPTNASASRTRSGVRRSSSAQSSTRQSVDENSLRNGAASGESSRSAATKPRRIASSASRRRPTSARRTLSTTNACLFASVTARAPPPASSSDDDTSPKSRPQPWPSGGARASMRSSDAPSAGSNFCRSRSARPSPAAACAAPCARYLKRLGPRRGGAPQPS
mmetsp:Transcript_14203/g.40635  ORF Transcript_14203/g.40635 Transcript_14203/m.40635 type:complete len:228 (-) Transcript_14203:34-717(-)